MDFNDKEIIKLAKYLKHWADHNESHNQSLLKWSEIAKKRGLETVAEKINKAIEMMEKSSEYLLSAQKELK